MPVGEVFAFAQVGLIPQVLGNRLGGNRIDDAPLSNDGGNQFSRRYVKRGIVNFDPFRRSAFAKAFGDFF